MIQQFYVIIPLLTPLSGHLVTGALLDIGYEMEVMFKQYGSVAKNESSDSSALTIRVAKDFPIMASDNAMKVVHDDLIRVLNASKTKYHMIIITEVEKMNFSLGNIKLKMPDGKNKPELKIVT